MVFKRECLNSSLVSPIRIVAEFSHSILNLPFKRWLVGRAARGNKQANEADIAIVAGHLALAINWSAKYIAKRDHALRRSAIHSLHGTRPIIRNEALQFRMAVKKDPLHHIPEQAHRKLVLVRRSKCEEGSVRRIRTRLALDSNAALYATQS